MAPVEKLECDNLIIGAGVIGLAAGAKLTELGSTIIVESHPQFGQETSSRNSEVIHSGIYYPPDSRKTEWCIAGRKILYDYCQNHDVPVAKTGKILVTVDPDEEPYLQKLAAHCKEVSVPCAWLTKKEIEEKEPLISVHSGLCFPESGILDSHQFMASLERQFLEKGGLTAYRHRFESTERTNDLWKSLVTSPQGSVEIFSKAIINAAGLAAAEIANQALSTNKYQHRYCRGRYFALSGKYQNKFRHLIYPVPPKDGLGVHVTVDLNHLARLGPDVDWSDITRYEDTPTLYDCDWDQIQPSFVTAVNRYSPSIQSEDLSPGLIGIRPKLFIDGKAHCDFLIENHHGFIHCLGIESPGLTASLAIANHLARALSQQTELIAPSG